MPPALGRQPCFKDSSLTAVARAGPRERKDKQETERLFIKLTGSVRNKGGLLSNVQTSREPGEQRQLMPCLPGKPRRAGDNSTPISKKEEKSHKCHMSQTARTCEKDQTGQCILFQARESISPSDPHRGRLCVDVPGGSHGFAGVLPAPTLISSHKNRLKFES